MSPTAIGQARRSLARSDAAEWVGRVGWVARAIVYGVMSLIVVQVAMEHGSGGPKADQKGALQAVAARPFGGALMIILALGFVAFALGRVVEIATNDDDGLKRWAKIASRAASAVSQLALAYLAMSFVGGAHRSDGGPSAKILGWPHGTLLVSLIGLAIMTTGAGFIVQGVRRKFMERLEKHDMSAKERRTALMLGISGLASRGVAFVLGGFFVVRAALDFDPQKTSGLDAALRAVARRPWGPPVLLALAFGLSCFAAYCGFMGRYRDITEG